MDANLVLLCRMAELEALVWGGGEAVALTCSHCNWVCSQGMMSRPPVLAECFAAADLLPQRVMHCSEE